MSLLREIERRIDERLRRLFRSSEPSRGQGRELVEIQRMILDAVDERVQMMPRARRAFPFNDVLARIPMPDEERRVAFEVVFIEDGALQAEIEHYLQREGIEFPRDMKVEVSLVEGIPEPALVCRNREAETETIELPEAGTARFTLPDGSSVESTKTRIHVGRMAEVLDDRRRLVRRNDLVIDSGTVSRAHAHIEFTAGEYRLFDDGSSYGTSAVHDGRLVEVARAGSRGLRLHSGDEIYFGQTRVLFEVVP